MSLAEALESLYARRRFGIRPGVDRVGRLLERLGNPENTFRTIHVAGTNGKGSTSAFLSSVLSHCGHTTGQFSSPHLVRFSERFRINGSEYPPEKLTHMLSTVLAAAPEEATFFEITTALAALIFSDEGVSIAVMEAGMGGGSDATAAFDGELTVLTPIDLDHTEYLGGTIERIAAEKAGIIKQNTNVVSARQYPEALRVISDTCVACSCSLKIQDIDFSGARNDDASISYSGIYESFTHLAPGIPGRYQTGNAAVALAAAETIMAVSGESFRAACIDGVAGARWPGRMEMIPGKIQMLLDGAHNPSGAAAVADALREYRYTRLLLVAGVCSDKDAGGIFAPLLPMADAVYTVTPSIERALRAEELSSLFSAAGVTSKPCGTVVEGIEKARSDAGTDDLILICGSLFVVGEVKAWLEQSRFTGIRG